MDCMSGDPLPCDRTLTQGSKTRTSARRSGKGSRTATSGGRPSWRPFELLWWACKLECKYYFSRSTLSRRAQVASRPRDARCRLLAAAAAASSPFVCHRCTASATPCQHCTVVTPHRTSAVGRCRRDLLGPLFRFLLRAAYVLPGHTTRTCNFPCARAPAECAETEKERECQREQAGISTQGLRSQASSRRQVCRCSRMYVASTDDVRALESIRQIIATCSHMKRELWCGQQVEDKGQRT
eukprot:scaffold3340_cov114-Isochrysis_galbana.AAC.13